MISVELDASSLAQTRLAVSPMFEALAWLQLTVAGKTHPVFANPGVGARAALHHPDLALVVAVLPPGGRGYMPDFLTPKPPLSTSKPAREQLELIAETAPEVVQQQLSIAAGPAGPLPAPVRAAAENGTFAARAASGLAYFWRTTLADRWPSIRRILERDMARRSDEIASKGLGKALQSLHPQLAWDGAALQVNLPWDEAHTFIGADVVLAPSALNWPNLSAQLCQQQQAVVFYPAGVPAPETPFHSRAAVEELLGRSRAGVLFALELPASTSTLADVIGLSPATVSFHLGVLHRAGLVVRTRQRHEVLYRRSAAGSMLVRD